MANAIVASTPGGIEAQEAAGQQSFCAGDMLPIEGTLTEKYGIDAMSQEVLENLKSLGFLFGKEVEDRPGKPNTFVETHLPVGWRKVTTDHSMWNKLLDANGNTRAMIFFKAAFYDYHAFVDWLSPLESVIICDDGKSPYDDGNYKSFIDGKSLTCRAVVRYKGKEIWRGPDHQMLRNDFKEYHNAQDEGRKWLKKHYPQSGDPFAYWESC